MPHLRARELRWNMTEGERRLWALLRRKRLANFRFRSQAQIGPYIADFFCPKAHLIVELDGGHHSRDERVIRDEVRTRWLETHGCRVMRIWNRDLFQRTDEVLDAVYRALMEAPLPSRASRATPSPTLRGGKEEIVAIPLSAACGAEISGVDLTRPLSPEIVRAIEHAWNQHLVLVFRGQNLTEEQQLRFASYFGELGNRKKAPAPLRVRAEGIQQDHEKILLVSNIKVGGEPIGAFREGEFWFRIDSDNAPRPYKYTFLDALELPSSGGNTLFANMYMAYESLPARLKEKLRGRRALHIHEYNRAKQANAAGDISGIPHCWQPIFSTHPDTGRKSLFVDRLMTTRIEGLSEAESDAILEELYAAGERREFVYEHVWQLDDFVMWDNRCTIHARTDFPKSERRLLRRCTLEGDVLYEFSSPACGGGGP